MKRRSEGVRGVIILGYPILEFNEYGYKQVY